MLSTIVGSRLPVQYQRFFRLPKRTVSNAIVDTADTTLGRQVASWMSLHNAANGVCRLADGALALDVRLKLIELAESTIDIQSYLVRDDLSGNRIMMALIAAAERGVRVRLLMDDALTQPVDPGLLAVSNHPKIDVRVFNPFPRHRSRFVSFIANFNLLNRRMHNKTFTVDCQFTIVGGRNLADEYFQSSTMNEFLDEDLLAIGNIVMDVSSGFDEYWNTRESTPIEFLGQGQSLPSIPELLQQGRQFLLEHSAEGAVAAQDSDSELVLGDGGLEVVAAEPELVLDHPDKVRGLVRARVGETTEHLAKMVSTAETELFVVSPYFVPLKAGVEFFASLVKRGVRVVVVTNSLASTNHSSVHAVYARYRKPLLQNGIELYELRRDTGTQEGATDPPATVTLHSKVAVVDRLKLFVGSFNLDPRSLYINTEMGMAVESNKLASEMAEDIETILPTLTYRLELTDKGRLCWSYSGGGVEETLHKEPHTTFWRRLSTWLMSLLPIEGQM